ncbi:MAG: dethiobiotin synthase [Firmicutes bacterium HGW-Firmicutes-1]|jgi:dethiobiotin synthetase|nr:MAG: dethiobiotin synthase [Firmicutes bacterium HGW-Firmicutes-1]
MSKGVFIIGTDTDVGKTVVSAGLMHLLRKNGYTACYFKPVLSGAIEDHRELIPGDTRFVKTVANLEETLENMTPYKFQTPVAPHLASKIENIPIQVEVIKKSYQNLCEKYSYILAEGAGGLVVPLTEEGYMLYNLVLDFELPIIIVARPGLGTINHTVMTVRYAQNLGITVKGIIINGYDDANVCHMDNKITIEKLTNVPILGLIPILNDIDVEKLQWGDLRECFEKNISVDILF